MNDHIKVWPFHDAPEQYQALSGNGGDEDWLALVPLDWRETQYIPWLEDYGPFGRCCIDWYEHADGWVVIGAHA